MPSSTRGGKVMKDPMHAWFTRPTADIKKDIREGKMELLYEKFYSEDFAGK